MGKITMTRSCTLPSYPFLLKIASVNIRWKDNIKMNICLTLYLTHSAYSMYFRLLSELTTWLVKTFLLSNRKFIFYP